MLNLDEIKARCEMATPGPWKVVEGKSAGVQSKDKNIAICFRRENEGFIAAARTDLPACVAEIERLQKENEQLKQEIRIGKHMFAPVTLDAASAESFCNAADVSRLGQENAVLKRALEDAIAESFGRPVSQAIMDEFIHDAKSEVERK